MKQLKFLIYLAFVSIVCLASVASCSGGNNAGSQKQTNVSATDESATVESANPSSQGNGDEVGLSKANESASKMPTVIDFYATWCGPCKNIAPLFNRLKGKYSSKINFVSVDVDQDVAMAEKFGIEAMPTFVFLDEDGNEIYRIVGADSAKLSEMVENFANQ